MQDSTDTLCIMKNKLDILFDPIDNEEFEWKPSGYNDDTADNINHICPCCLVPNGEHDKKCPMLEID